MADAQKDEGKVAIETSAGRLKGGVARIDLKVEFDLDDSSIFNLSNGGIKVVAVTEN